MEFSEFTHALGMEVETAVEMHCRCKPDTEVESGKRHRMAWVTSVESAAPQMKSSSYTLDAVVMQNVSYISDREIWESWSSGGVMHLSTRYWMNSCLN